jgi:hypothetical protein
MYLQHVALNLRNTESILESQHVFIYFSIQEFIFGKIWKDSFYLELSGAVEKNKNFVLSIFVGTNSVLLVSKWS